MNNVPQTDNALEWADFFIATKNENSWSLNDIDEDLMIAWFANAIETSKDFAKKELEQENTQLKAKYQESCRAWRDQFQSMHERAMRAEARIAQLENPTSLMSLAGTIAEYYNDETSNYFELAKCILSEFHLIPNTVRFETPQQSLVEYNCEVIKEMMTNITPSKRGNKVCFFMEDMFAYIEQRRNSVKDGNDG